MATAQQQFRSTKPRSPKDLLRVMTIAIVVLMIMLCGVGTWGLFTLQQSVAVVTQESVPALNALNDAHVALLSVQRDDRQASLDSYASARTRDIALIRIHTKDLRDAISTYLGLPHPFGEPLNLADLNQSVTAWLAFEHIFVGDLLPKTDHGDAEAITLLDGYLAIQENRLSDLLMQSQHIEQADVTTIRANAYNASQNALKLLLGVGLVLIIATLLVGIGMTRHLTWVYAQVAAINRQLEASVEDVQSHNEELSVQQLSLRQANAALEAAIDERHQAERQLVAALDESERLGRHLQAIFASVQDALLVLDPQGKERYRNRACETLLGLEAGVSLDLRHPPCKLFALDGQLIPEESLPLSRVLSGGQPGEQTIYVLRFPDGVCKVAQLEAIPIYAADGTLNSVLGVMRDITTSHREERHKALLQSLAHHCALALTEAEIAQTAARILQSGLAIVSCDIFVRRLDHPAYAESLTADLGATIEPTQRALLQAALDICPVSADAPLPALQVIATGETRMSQVPLANGNWLPTGQIAFLPLSNAAQTFGALAISFAPDERHVWDVLDQELFHTVADEIAVALHRARLHAEVQALAFHDPLTGLYNHRALHQQLQSATDAATRGTHPLSVIMIDVDHFRSFNETYGHDIGDQALKTVAQTIASTIRVQDVAARYGGEEFTVLLPETSDDEALLIAERIRMAIAAARVWVPEIKDEVPMTASFGVATYPTHTTAVGSLLKAADIALYGAKHRGRNQVCSYSAQLLLTTEAQEDLPTEQPAFPH